MRMRTPYFAVTIEGVDISSWVDSVTVTEDDRQADSVALAVADPRMAYADALFEGSTVEVDLGYAEPGGHALLLRATVTKVELSYPDGGIPALTLKGEDRSILMGLQERNKVWRGRTVTDIVRAVAQPYRFADVIAQLQPDPRIERRPVHQDGKTDLAFLQELAETYHAKCFVELDERGDELLYFIPERRVVVLRRPDRIVLRYRSGPQSNLISFSPAFDSSYIDRLKEIADLDEDGRAIESQEKPPAEIVLWTLDSARTAAAGTADRERIERLFRLGSERKRDLQRQLTERRPLPGRVAPDQAELESMNDAFESRRLGMSASGSTFGNIWLRAKSRATITGTSERTDGDWYVSSVTHKIDGGGFRTDFKALR